MRVGRVLLTVAVTVLLLVALVTVALVTLDQLQRPLAIDGPVSIRSKV